MSLAQVRVANPTSTNRDTPAMFRCVVPFVRGLVAPDLPLRLQSGLPSSIVPFGARWDDGSLRYGLVRGFVDVPAGGSVDLDVEQGLGSIVEHAKTTELRPAPRLGRGWIEEGSTWVSTSAGYSDPIRWRSLDGEMWAVLLVEPSLDWSHAFWQLTVGWSNPLNPDLQFRAPEALELIAPSGAALSCYWGNQKGTSLRFENGHWILTLLPGSTIWGNGQAQMWRGAVIMSSTSSSALAALERPLMAIAKNWRDSGAWGPFGSVPDLPTWMPNAQAGIDWAHRRISARDASPRSDPWYESSYGCRKVPGSTGDQADFGIMQCFPALATMDPTVLDLYLPGALQEACRPVHFVEADASIVRAANHPQLRLWDRIPHFDETVCPDRLGKRSTTVPSDVADEFLNGSLDTSDPASNNWLQDLDRRTLSREEAMFLEQQASGPLGSFETHGWWGHDNQHYSANELLCAYQLTGDPQLGLLVEHLIESFLSGQNVSPPLPPGFPTSGADAPRAVGRTLLTGSQAYLVSGRSDLLARLDGRVDLAVLPGWFGRNLGGPGPRPLQVTTTDGRQSPIPIGSFAWFPWQEALAVTGLEAVFRVTGHQPARDIAIEVARTVAQFGWQSRNGGRDFQIANCVLWNNGQPVNRDDPLQFQPADGTDFYLWAGAATRFATAQGIDEAVAILASIVTRANVRPSDGGFTRYEQWMAI